MPHRRLRCSSAFVGAKETKFSGKKLLKNVDPNLFTSENGVCQLSPFPTPPPQFLGVLLTPPPRGSKNPTCQMSISTLLCECLRPLLGCFVNISFPHYGAVRTWLPHAEAFFEYLSRTLGHSANVPAPHWDTL